MVPLLGMAIGTISGLYRGLNATNPMFWATTAFVTLISYVTWEGNRRFWGGLRRKPDWLDRPILRASMLAIVNLGWTAITSISLLLVWTFITGQSKPDWPVIETLTLTSILCTSFLAHAYETAYLVRQRRKDRRARVSLELAALNAQVDPHFIYNSLNTIVELNDENPALASEFAINLAEVYRYVVLNAQRQSVTVTEELDLLQRYTSLLRTRFGEGIRLHLPKSVPQFHDLHLPPVSLQVLMENVVKHNRFSEQDPIEVDVLVSSQSITMRNQKRPLAKKKPSSRTGLANLDQRCKLICGSGIEISENETSFEVTVPLC